MNVFEFSDYRHYLKSELAQRISRNSKYSLRAMARSLGVASSTLSEVMNGRANLSVLKARKIAEVLLSKETEMTYFCDLVLLDGEKDPDIKSFLSERLQKTYPKARVTTDLSMELFKQMSEWYHLAILEMPFLKDQKVEPVEIAKKLNISKLHVQLAIERLLKLGMFEVNDSGDIVRSNPELRIQSELKNSAMRKYYRSMLDKVSSALEEQSPKERLSGYMNLAIDPAALPEMDKAIDAFFADVKRISEKHKNKTTVYHLNLHFINLFKKEHSDE